MLKQITMLLLCAVMGVAALSVITGCGAKPAIITKAEYDQLKDGMSYEDAARIIGNPGNGMEMKPPGNPPGSPAPATPPPSTMKMPKVMMYNWINDDKSGANATFVDNKMVSHAWLEKPSK